MIDFVATIPARWGFQMEPFIAQFFNLQQGLSQPDSKSVLLMPTPG